MRALREVAQIAISENVRTRNLSELLSQFKGTGDVSTPQSERGRLLAVILLCCNADSDCPHLDKLLPPGCSLIKEPVPGPMEMMQRSCGGLTDEHGKEVSAEDTQKVYHEFISNMEEFVQQRLPQLIPHLLVA